MTTRLIAIAAMLFTSVCQAQNFTGDPELVAAAEEARVRSAVFWTGRELPTWKTPCPIVWERGNRESSSGSSGHRYEPSGTESHISLSGPRELAIVDALPHEVDHVVRHYIIGKPIPRWLDEGCASQFESRASKKIMRSALLYGNLKSSVWDMFGMSEYPKNSVDQMTALYSGSASLVEWMLEMSSPRDLMRAQEASLDSHQKWKLYVGEDASISRQRYEKWFAAKYGSGNPEPALPSKNYIDVWVAGDFNCPPCESFKRHIKLTGAARGFDYHLHPISYKDCQERGIAVPMFVAGNIVFDGPIRTWSDVDNWARKQLQVTRKPKATPPPPADNGPLPVREPQLDPPPVPVQRDSVAPGITATPEAIRVIGEMLDPRKEPRKETAINWEGLTILVAISNEFPVLAMAGEGPGRRAVQRLTGGKASITVISERGKPTLFNSYQEALGLDVKKFHISILVPESILVTDVEAAVNKVEIIFNNNVSNFSEEKPGDIPVEIISELISPLDYNLVKAVLNKTPEKVDGDESFISKEVVQSSFKALILGGLLGIAFYYYRKKPVEPVS